MAPVIEALSAIVRAIGFWGLVFVLGFFLVLATLISQIERIIFRDAGRWRPVYMALGALMMLAAGAGWTGRFDRLPSPTASAVAPTGTTAPLALVPGPQTPQPATPAPTVTPMPPARVTPAPDEGVPREVWLVTEGDWTGIWALRSDGGWESTIIKSGGTDNERRRIQLSMRRDDLTKVTFTRVDSPDKNSCTYTGDRHESVMEGSFQCSPIPTNNPKWRAVLTSPSAPELRRVWSEVEADNNLAGTWTRHGATNEFTAEWRDAGTGRPATSARVSVYAAEGRVIVRRRSQDSVDGNDCSYYGEYRPADAGFVGKYGCDRGTPHLLDWRARLSD